MSISKHTEAVLLLLPSDHGLGDDRPDLERIGEYLPGIRVIRYGEGHDVDADADLILFPAAAPDTAAVISKLTHAWINAGTGTVFRTTDGVVHSRFIPYSFNEGSSIIGDAGFYLDGLKNNVLVLGEKETPAFQTFISSVRSLIGNRLESNPVSADLAGIESYIRLRFESDFPSLAYHNPVHIQDVYDSALRIAAAEGIGPEERDLICVAALFHDAGFIHTMDKHEECGADMAAGVMPCFGFSQAQISKVRDMILATRLPQDPKNLLERIICDADLDYLGREDFYPIGNRLFQELQETGKVKDAHTWNTIQKKFLSAHRYHTEFCRSHREPQKQVRLQEIEQLLS